MRNKEGKEIKGIQIGKDDVKLSLFTDDMILYLKKILRVHKKTFRAINTFTKST
jgi:hypothetical protein